MLSDITIKASLTCGICTGSRRLLTYKRIPDSRVTDCPLARQKVEMKGSTANDLNSFRKRVKYVISKLILLLIGTNSTLKALKHR